MRISASSPSPSTDIIAGSTIPKGVAVTLRGMVQGMRASFRSFSIGLVLAVLLLYLILVAQFQSFMDPFIILLAVPPGLAGVLITLVATGTTLNVMSLMGVVMLVGIAVSNSILIVEFTRHLRHEGMDVRAAVSLACRVRLRPVLMTSLATIIGLMPMALKLGEGSEAYAPLARALIGGSVGLRAAVTIFLVPAGFCLAYGRAGRRRPWSKAICALVAKCREAGRRVKKTVSGSFRNGVRSHRSWKG
ncbi:MAG: efflux RND transporter permease subunit [Paludibaculum sp.]